MKTLALVLAISWSLSGFAQSLTAEAFHKKFKLVKNDKGEVTAIKLKQFVPVFSVAPYIAQIKEDLIEAQKKFRNQSLVSTEAMIDEMLTSIGEDPYSFDEDSNGRRIKESLLNVPNIKINETFTAIDAKDFWKEFESKMSEALMFIDPSVMCRLDDSRFFYKKQVTYQVVNWALNQAKKKFANVPVLNLASYVIVRIHSMMLDSRTYHHNMLLHYFENATEGELGMTKAEVDRAMSSIYEYQIPVSGYFESNNASANWDAYGWNKFYQTVRAGNTRIREWQSPFSSLNYQDIKKVNFGYAEAKINGARKLISLTQTQHQFSSKPAVSYDYSAPAKIRQNRALLQLGQAALGFITIPAWIKNNVDSFISSTYVNQSRAEGSLVAHFELQGDANMAREIYRQKANPYIILK